VVTTRRAPQRTPTPMPTPRVGQTNVIADSPAGRTCDGQPAGEAGTAGAAVVIVVDPTAGVGGVLAVAENEQPPAIHANAAATTSSHHRLVHTTLTRVGYRTFHLARPTVCRLEVGYSARAAAEQDRRLGAVAAFASVDTSATPASAPSSPVEPYGRRVSTNPS
jgi:hypothetical protein